MVVFSIIISHSQIFLLVDGQFGDWSDWGTCTVTCGGGEQKRIRTCANPAPQYGGKPCNGETTEARDCNTLKCPSMLINIF